MKIAYNRSHILFAVLFLLPFAINAQKITVDIDGECNIWHDQSLGFRVFTQMEDSKYANIWDGFCTRDNCWVTKIQLSRDSELNEYDYVDSVAYTSKDHTFNITANEFNLIMKPKLKVIMNHNGEVEITKLRTGEKFYGRCRVVK